MHSGSSARFPTKPTEKLKIEKMYAIKQIKICAEYRDMLPRPRLDLSGTPGLRPIGLSPGSWQTSLGLGSMSRYSAQILICITFPGVTSKSLNFMDDHMILGKRHFTTIGLNQLRLSFAYMRHCSRSCSLCIDFCPMIRSFHLQKIHVNVACKITTVLFRPQCVRKVYSAEPWSSVAN